MKAVPFEREVVIDEPEDVRHIGIDCHLGQRIRLAGELLVRLPDVVRVEVSITECMYELARLKIVSLRHHHRQ